MPARNFEVAIGFDAHAPHIPPALFPFGDDCADQVSCAKSVHATGSFGTANGKAMLIHVHHLPLLPACGLDQPGADRQEAQACRGRGTTARGIHPVHFGQPARGAVPFRQSP